jgi:hypothetical protein
VKHRLTLWERFTAFLKTLWWWWKGKLLNIELKDELSPVRTEAQMAVDRVVMETDITPDCVSAQVVRGGCTIMVKHNEAWEAFVHNSYNEAAEKAIEWLLLQGDEIKTNKVTKLNRKSRRAFDVVRKAERQHKQKLH